VLIVYLEKINAFAFRHAEARKNLATWKSDVEKLIGRTGGMYSGIFLKLK